MNKFLFRSLGLILLLILCANSPLPSLAQQKQESWTGQKNLYQPPTLREVPQEVKELFQGGMTVEEFVAINHGKMPNAIRQTLNEPVTLIVELDQPPLVEYYLQEREANKPLSLTLQRAYLENLRNNQKVIINNINTLNGLVIDRYARVYNGLLVRVPLGKIEQLRKIPGVKDIHRAPVHVPALSVSVPLIGATDVISQTGFDGSGVTIAIIDTGIDYTHAAFGGSGDPSEYASNDPNIVEPGTFPTAKVIGGYDFAGSKYDAGCTDAEEKAGICSTVPVEDEDPLDENGHGTHVASIAAGLAVPGSPGISHGVAPGASLYALKVFGASGSTNLVISAIEWAMDPNKDGDLSDRVDIINLSLGSDFGPATDKDPEIMAINYATKLGVIVVAASGNAGNVPYITGSPGVAEGAISVAASTTGYLTGPTISISGTSIITNTNILYQPSAFDNNTGHFTTALTAPLYYVGNLPGTNTDELCTIVGLPVGVLEGKVALVKRGTCNFSTKVNNAEQLGAKGVVIFNHEEGGNQWVTMSGGKVNVPAGFIRFDDGKSLIRDHGKEINISAEGDVETIQDRYSIADNLAGFSSRGPRGNDSKLKPDITAPGVGIYAARMGSGNGGISMSGTSMATPHIAGVAALLRQAHGDWTAEQIKAAMMNTAVDLMDEKGQPVNEIPRQGAGRVDAYRSVKAKTIATGEPYLVSLNWGIVPIGNSTYVNTKYITLQNFSTEPKTYSVGWSLGTESKREGIDIFVPKTVEIKPSPGFAYVPVSLSLDATKITNEFLLLEEYYGFIEFKNTSDAQDVLRVPFYVVPLPYSQLTIRSSELGETSGLIHIEQSGPITSAIQVYPLYFLSDNNPDLGDEGDLRMVGMDFGWNSETYGPIIKVAFNVYGSWHTPQPYFAEFDLYIDANEDGVDDYLDFNWNYGASTGGNDDDVWVVVKYDLSSKLLYLGSPWEIFTDYNTGIMEYWLPAEWHGLNNQNNTDFGYWVQSWETNYFGDGKTETSPKFAFDFARPPFGWSLDSAPTPLQPEATITYWLENPGGYFLSKPIGLMIVDYQGYPGYGQSYAHLFEFENPFHVFLPQVMLEKRE